MKTNSKIAVHSQHHSQHHKINKKLVNRLHIIQGQVQGLEKMVGDQKYCIDIIRLSLAIQKSLQSFNQAMLENHLKEHVADQYKHGKDAKATKELLDIYTLSNK